jgi:acyl-CoA reductase-like NAD-dependent aldehyde dehydrogenase
MTQRLDVLKTYKLYIDGAFPRSESGRTTPVPGTAKGKTAPPVLAHVAKASRKDLRDAVEAARRAQPKWSDATPYLRGQILYRMAEMLEGKRDEFVDALESVQTNPKPSKSSSRSKRGPAPMPLSPTAEVSLSIDRLVNYAGWSDKFSQVVGCQNAVAGPFYNFTIPEATGVVAAIAPAECPLLALTSLIAPAICAGNAVVALASERNPIVGAILGEVLATSDLPGGVVNILTAEHDELLPHIASHRDIDAIHAANLSPARTTLLRTGIAENLKRTMIHNRVDFADIAACQNPWWIEPFVEFKTIWHPSAV